MGGTRTVAARLRALHPVVLALALLIVLPELVLEGADRGWWGSPRWRGVVYVNGALWVGLLQGWQPNFPAQPVTMFLTHAFLHGGFVHLATNTVTLLSLGPPVLDRLGAGRFTLLWAGSVLGGAVGFVTLAETARPMVGASGALFGLAGAWVALGAVEARQAALAAIGGTAARGARLRTGFRAAVDALAWPVGVLVALNLVMIVLTPGGIAWQAHLGGGLAGAVLGVLLGQVRRPEAD